MLYLILYLIGSCLTLPTLAFGFKVACPEYIRLAPFGAIVWPVSFVMFVWYFTQAWVESRKS